jgi:hypothetical protein
VTITDAHHVGDGPDPLGEERFGGAVAQVQATLGAPLA